MKILNILGLFLCLFYFEAKSQSESPWAYPIGGLKYYTSGNNFIMKMDVTFSNSGGVYSISDQVWNTEPTCPNGYSKVWMINEGQAFEKTQSSYFQGWRTDPLVNVQFPFGGDHVIRKGCKNINNPSENINNISEQVIHIPRSINYNVDLQESVPNQFKLRSDTELPTIFNSSSQNNLPEFTLPSNKFFMNLAYKPEKIGNNYNQFHLHGVTNQDIGGTAFSGGSTYYYDNIVNSRKGAVLQTSLESNGIKKTPEQWSNMSLTEIEGLAGDIAGSTYDPKRQGIVISNNEMINQNGPNFNMPSQGRYNLYHFYNTIKNYRSGSINPIKIGAYYSQPYFIDFHAFFSNDPGNNTTLTGLANDFDATNYNGLFSNLKWKTVDSERYKNQGVFETFEYNGQSYRTADLFDIVTVDGILNTNNTKSYLSILQSLRVSKNLESSKSVLLYVENFHEIQDQNYDISFIGDNGSAINGTNQPYTLEARSMTPSPAYYQFTGLIGTLIGDGIIFWGPHEIDLDVDKKYKYKVAQSINANLNGSIVDCRNSNTPLPNNFRGLESYGGYYRGHEDYLWLGVYQANEILNKPGLSSFSPVPIKEENLPWQDNSTLKNYYPSWRSKFQKDNSSSNLGAFAMAANFNNGYIIIAFNDINNPEGVQDILVRLPNGQEIPIKIYGQYPTIKTITNGCSISSPTITSNKQNGVGPNESATLTAAGCSGTVKWYNTPNNGTLLATANSYITPAISTNTTFYASCTVGSCVSSRTALTLTYNPPSTNDCFRIVSKKTGKMIKTPAVNSGEWLRQNTYNSSDNNMIWKFTDSDVNNYEKITLASNPAYIISASSNTATDYYWIVQLNANHSNDYGHWKFVESSYAPGWYKIINKKSSDLLLSIDNGNQSSENAVLYYYQDFEVANNSANDFQLWKKEIVTCPSNSCSVSSPTITSNKQNGVGPNESATLTAAGCSGTVKWYNTPNNGTLLATANSYITPAISTNTTFYASCTVGSCVSSRTALTLTYNPPSTNDCFRIVSKKTGKMIKTPAVNSGEWLRQNTYNSSDNNMIWKFTDSDVNNYEKITLASNPAYIISASSNTATDYYWIVQLNANHSNDYGHWKFVESSYAPGWYKIINKKSSDLLLSIDNGNQSSENAVLYYYQDFEVANNSANDFQLWKKEIVTCPSNGARLSTAPENDYQEQFDVLNVSPNPFENNFKIKVYAKKNQNAVLNFHTINGKHIEQKLVELKTGINYINLDGNTFHNEKNILMSIIVDEKIQTKNIIHN